MRINNFLLISSCFFDLVKPKNRNPFGNIRFLILFFQEGFVYCDFDIVVGITSM